MHQWFRNDKIRTYILITELNEGGVTNDLATRAINLFDDICFYH